MLKRAYGTKLGRRRMDGLMLRTLFGDRFAKPPGQFCRTFSAYASGGPDLDGARHRATVGSRVLSEAIEGAKTEVRRRHLRLALAQGVPRWR